MKSAKMEGIANDVPAALYRPSTPSYPTRLRPIEYPTDFEVRRVAASGRIRWHDEMVTVNHALEGELIGIQPGDGIHLVFRDPSAA